MGLERREKGLLLRFTKGELARIDTARGSLSRGRWVRALVLDGLAQGQIGPGVLGSVKAQTARHEALAASGAPVLRVEDSAPAGERVWPRAFPRDVRPPRSGVFGRGVPDD